MEWATWKFEQELAAQGFAAIVGVDEVGAGAWAGPVMAGAVVLPLGCELRVCDSKLLSPAQRERLVPEIQKHARCWAIGSASVEEIGALGIRPATYLAMRRAIDAFETKDMVLVDAWTIPDIPVSQRGIIRGDRQSVSIAAASILAKVARDALMRELAELYPAYGFDAHKGYGTRQHQDALRASGPCPIHRMNYRPVWNSRAL